MEYYSALKDKTRTHTTAGISPRNTRLSKVGQTQKEKRHTILLTQDCSCKRGRPAAESKRLYQDAPPAQAHSSPGSSFLFI